MNSNTTAPSKKSHRHQDRRREDRQGQDSRTGKTRPADGIWLDGSGSNWSLFETLFQEHASKEYGDLARELGAKDDIEFEISEPTFDKKSFEYAMAVEQMKLRIKQMDDFRRARPQLFGDIFRHVSLASERKIRQHPDFDKADEDRSPRLLWEIVRSTHIAPQHAGQLGT